MPTTSRTYKYKRICSGPDRLDPIACSGRAAASWTCQQQRTAQTCDNLGRFCAIGDFGTGTEKLNVPSPTPFINLHAAGHYRFPSKLARQATPSPPRCCTLVPQCQWHTAHTEGRSIVDRRVCQPNFFLFVCPRTT